MTRVRVKEQLDGDLWNLKVGCYYDLEKTKALSLAKDGKVELLLETAMKPSPGVKNARKGTSPNRVSGDSVGGEKAPKADD
tara:strand:- start:2486 stop:2728 length:243 start_codon:yes stop_codon:yes gene_type:complete